MGRKKNNASLLIVLASVAAGLMLLGCMGVVTLLISLPQAAPRLEAIADAGIVSQIADSPGRPDWTPDANEVAQLGPEVTFGEHAMRLPPGFVSGTQGHPVKSESSSGVGKTLSWGWHSSLASHNMAIMQAEIREAPETINGAEYFEQQLPAELKRHRKSNSGDHFECEAGRIGGKRAVRTTIQSRKDGIVAVKIYRFEGNRLLMLSMACSSADQERLRLMQAAMLTVREIDEIGGADFQHRR
jgi:hypothetical protein